MKITDFTIFETEKKPPRYCTIKIQLVTSRGNLNAKQTLEFFIINKNI